MLWRCSTHPLNLLNTHASHYNFSAYAPSRAEQGHTGAPPCRQTGSTCTNHYCQTGGTITHNTLPPNNGRHTNLPPSRSTYTRTYTHAAMLTHTHTPPCRQSPRGTHTHATLSLNRSTRTHACTNAPSYRQRGAVPPCPHQRAVPAWACPPDSEPGQQPRRPHRLALPLGGPACSPMQWPETQRRWPTQGRARAPVRACMCVLVCACACASVRTPTLTPMLIPTSPVLGPLT